MKLSAALVAACVALVGATPAWADPAEPTVEQTIKHDVELSKRPNILTVVLENDLYGGGTDQNYTNGIRVNYTDVNAHSTKLAQFIDRLVPTFALSDTTAFYYSFGQNLYTPRDITQSVANPNDRPWAAFLYASMGMVTLSENHMDEVEATLGVIGPAALGEPAQKFVHQYISDSPEPQGWHNQLKNEPGIILAWQRSLPSYWHADIGDNYLSFKPYAGLTVGNIHTYADAGFSVRFSPSDSKWQDTPLRVRPAMPGTGIYEVPEHKWSWALFGGLEGRAIARDIFLDGNTFANSASIEKKNFVADATAGVALTYGNYRISYTMVYRTKEFYQQERAQVFGAISGSIRF